MTVSVRINYGKFSVDLVVYLVIDLVIDLVVDLVSI